MKLKIPFLNNSTSMDVHPNPAVVKIQGQLDKNRAARTALDEALTAQQVALAAAVQVDESTLNELQQRYEDALADEALGLVSADPSEKLTLTLAKVKTALEKERQGKAALAESAQRAIAGLERRRQQLDDEFARLNESRLAALFAALEAEHTQARQTYVASANALLDAYGRILALARVAQDLGCQPLPAFMFHNLMLPKPADMSDCDAPLAPCGNEPYQMGNAYSFVAIISGHQDRLRAAYP
ncbi:MAG TPA: hypothetical protein DIC59_04605 [Candidatus Competibacteraceae bacterium]|nr:hypothetical protein [Candidatus Competibacteraceae bacterium]